MPAKGRVLARVWHEMYKEGEPMERHWLRSGSTATARVLRIWNREVVLSGTREAPFSRFESDEKGESILPWRNSGGPVEVIDITHHELREVKHPLSVEECIRRLTDQALAELKLNLDEGSQITKVDKKVLSQPEDSLIRVWVRIEAVEDIAMPIPYYPQKREGGPAVGGTNREEDTGGRP